MTSKQDTARINAANIKNYDDQTFTDLYNNPGIIFFGSEEELKAVEERAEGLGLGKRLLREKE